MACQLEFCKRLLTRSIKPCMMVVMEMVKCYELALETPQAITAWVGFGWPGDSTDDHHASVLPNRRWTAY